ncbi:ATP-binding protein [Streptomyces sp. NPDC014991]|uniref:ATP-binding protein n=1 Tax=Streptomyces sp. NPDC014991 TaxID=3364935 RepID=UPI0037017B34
MAAVRTGTTEGAPDFGATLRELRLAASLTMEGLAEASGLSVRGIGDLERGRRAAPQRRTITALAAGLGLSDVERQRLLSAARAGRSDGYTPVGVQTVRREITDFVGRERELSWLTELARQISGGQTSDRQAARPGPSVRPVIAAVSGPPGAGKTTLALHAARRLAGHFPDGQVVVDMRGLETDPPEPAELMLGVLRALRVADRELLKVGSQGHIGLYRQTLAERRFVLVLDNARDEAQVRPLLPGSGAGIVLVTSRRMLTGLEGVHRLLLDGFDTREATALLTALVGRERASADTGALEKVARYCGHLPLALRLAGNWLAAQKASPVRRLAERLAPDDGRLEALAAGDVRVSTAFDLSYRRLTSEAARLFRRLALVPGPDVSAAGAAKLSGQQFFDAEDTLEELVEAGLLGAERDRYRLHDLLRLYARTRLDAEETPEDIGRARTALCDWLLRTAVVAGRWFEPGYGAPSVVRDGGVDLSSAVKGREWLQAEGANWLAALRVAAEAGQHATVVEVAESLHWFSDQWIFWGHWPEVYATAVDCARVLGDPVLEATQLNYLAWARLLCEGRHRDSLTLSARALALAQVAADTTQQAWAHFYRAWALSSLSEYEAAADHMSRAGHLFASLEDAQGSLTALHGSAMILSSSGRNEEAAEAFQHALAFLEEAGDRIEIHCAEFTRAEIHAGIAHVSRQLNKWDEAVVHLRKSIGLSSKSGNTALESRSLDKLGRVLLGMGRTAEAREVFARIISLGPYADPRTAREAAVQLDAIDARRHALQETERV